MSQVSIQSKCIAQNDTVKQYVKLILLQLLLTFFTESYGGVGADNRENWAVWTPLDSPQIQFSVQYNGVYVIFTLVIS